MRILLIDDNKADRVLYQKLIEECNLFQDVEINGCGNLSEAFETLKNFDYDLIILDLGLPESDGIETITSVYQELQKKKRIPPIIVLTGLEDHLIGTEAFKHGVKDFLIKSEIMINSKELSRAIKYATYSMNFSE
jgi:CheY-like chemotaxis protein